MHRRTFLKTAAAVSLRGNAAEPPDLRLWYRQPAPDWNEALPIGNGRLGAMIFGGVSDELLQLNDNTLWSDEPGRRDLPLDVTKNFGKVMDMLRRREYAEASQYITKHWGGRAQPCYQPLGDLHIRFEGHSSPGDYTRDLDLGNATSTVRYTLNGVAITREYFASFPDQVIVIRLTADRAKALSLRARLSTIHPTGKTRNEGSDAIVLTGKAPGFALRRTLEWVEQRGEQWKYPEVWDKDGKRKPGASTVMYGDLGTSFEARVRAVKSDGSAAATAEGLEIRDASEVVLLLSAATSYNGFGKSPSREGVDPCARAREHIDRAARKQFPEFRQAHISDYKKLFDRVSLQLGSPSDQSSLPTDQRIVQFSNDRDPGLAVLYFQYGRYLMIAGSRPGGQPLNLQGIWNKEVIPPWASAYTTNINTEMNYWPAEVANLSECHEPLLRMLRELSITGGEVAKNMYRRRGWVEHHNTTVWRDAQPIDYNAMPSFWNVGGAWLATHAWEHYLFTQDRNYLAKEGYAVMKGAAEFLSDWLIDDGKGRLVTAAGNSPEIEFHYIDAKGEKKLGGMSMGPTMDLAIARHLFSACIAASELLDRDADFRNTLKQKLDKLLPYQIGSRGNLQEWAEDVIERDQEHRHISHLYALHPGSDINKRATPKLYAAAKRTLELRGDEGTGWSRAWKINFWARMEDGNHAYKLVRNLFEPAKSGEIRYTRGGVLPNLLCSHPPFQIDGNFGGAAGIAEMLLQSHREIHLLPALPDVWPEGQVRGLRARGGFEIDMEWKNAKLRKAALRSIAGQTCTVRYGDKTIKLETKPGVLYALNSELALLP